jgi:Mrp family chromosome partitioning ATPase
MKQKKIFTASALELSKSNMKDQEHIVLRDTPLLPVTIAKDALVKLDEKMVTWKHFNSFNFSKLSSAFGKVNMSIGITSANRGDGKTLVASNMAVSLTRGYQRRTVIVDMNFNNPSLHKVFGAEPYPGVAEAIRYNNIRILPTAVNNLFLMTAGDCKGFKPGIEHTLVLREILNSLKDEFDFVIVDLGSILPIHDFPAHFVNEIDGLINVVNVKSTKKGDLNKVFKHLDERRFLGYIFNKID